MSFGSYPRADDGPLSRGRCMRAEDVALSPGIGGEGRGEVRTVALPGDDASQVVR
jgi:hypothetical protein